MYGRSNKEIAGFDGEHVKSLIGVTESLVTFRGFAELILKVYLIMERKISGNP